MGLRHTANLRVLDTVSDTSDISQRLFPGQFYRWTIQLELQDGFLFNIPYKTNNFVGGASLSSFDDTGIKSEQSYGTNDIKAELEKEKKY